MRGYPESDCCNPPQKRGALELRFEDFRELFEQAPGLFLVLSPNLTIVAVSNAYLAATMTARENIVGRKLFDVFPDNPEDPQATGVRNLAASLDTVLKTKAEHRMAVQKYEIRRPEQNGGGFEVRFWSPLNSPVLDTAGNVRFIVHRVEDVTDLVRLRPEREQRDQQAQDLEAEVLKKTGELGTLTALLQAERAARHTEEEFRQLADGIPQLAWMARNDGWVYWFNRRWFDYTGTTPEEMSGWGWQSVHDPDILPAVLQKWRASIETGSRFEMIFPLRGGDGRFRPFLTLVTPLRDETGEVIRWFGTHTDISEQIDEQARNRRALEERYRLLIETMSDYAIFTLDPSGTIASWNPGAEQLKGYTPAEIIGQNFSRFYTEEDRAIELPKHVLKTALQEGHYQGEGWRVRKDGSRFWASVVVTPLRSETGELVGFSKITRDMTDRKRLMDQLQQYAHELELRIAERDQTNADLEAFSYSVAHDLRAPLRAVEGFTDAVLEDFGGQLPERAREYLQLVVRSSERMDRLISDLLQYSKVSRAEIACSPVDLQAAVEEALQAFDEQTRSRISTDIEPGLAAMAHRRTLVQAVYNLASNALKFYPAGEAPHAEIRAFRSGDNAIIDVHDNGIGIEPRFQEQIFKIFERLHSPDRYPGTGIGLAIVDRGIARMGGKVRVQSVLGKGSTFTIEVPLA
jgi:PAS domain S-box-containing protein